MYICRSIYFFLIFKNWIIFFFFQIIGEYINFFLHIFRLSFSDISIKNIIYMDIEDLCTIELILYMGHLTLNRQI